MLLSSNKYHGPGNTSPYTPLQSDKLCSHSWRELSQQDEAMAAESKITGIEYVFSLLVGAVL
jgi:hypothetical protein